MAGLAKKFNQFKQSRKKTKSKIKVLKVVVERDGLAFPSLRLYYGGSCLPWIREWITFLVAEYQVQKKQAQSQISIG